MRKKLAKFFEGLLITGFIVLQAVLLGGYIKLKQEQTLLHDALWHAHDKLHVARAELYEHKSTNYAHGHKHTHPLPELYKKAIKDINKAYVKLNELIKVVRENGEYCVKRGDVGCGQ